LLPPIPIPIKFRITSSLDVPVARRLSDRSHQTKSLAGLAIMNFLSLFTLVLQLAQASATSDLASLLQQPQLPVRAAAAQNSASQVKEPFVIGLRRESVPIYRKGKVASFKTSYSGVLNVGTPAQEFRVVFDTGSGNVVLPAAECKSEACLMPDRRRFDMKASESAVAINADGSTVPEGEACDSVTIGFGTGEITGEFVRDRVCFGSPPGLVPQMNATQETELCVEMSVVLAVEMSSQPFKTFRFDGILGLGLDSLAMSKQFSAFDMIMGGRMAQAHFGVFLTEGEDGEESEIAMGGVDQKRVLEPLSWANVAMPELGYWQVPIVAVRVNGQELDVCKDGTCRGVVDTGTSHLGIPAPYDAEVAQLLTREAGDLLDCRLVDAPEVEIELPGKTLTLHAHNYMRRLPLREGVSVSSVQGVQVAPQNASNTTNTTNATSQTPPSGDTVGSASASPATGSDVALQEENARRFCRPRLMPVRLPEPLGPKLFILGEPLLHRYYTVYDWANHRVGFSLANSRRNTMDPSELVDKRGVLPKEVDMLLMQQKVKINRPGSSVDQDEIVAMVQVKVTVSVRSRAL